ncbi:AfsR/SARP family transcriptional regulator [Catenuloplanes sp. NPDC051500]|uniref:AfsR/SARP family transcriptional regulator n=1 Tax=Catenuloplanes sp. NPDC051500 TaxID=3363959 RepID=UPI0037B28A79
MDRDARVRIALLGAFRATRGEIVLTVPGARLQGLLVRLALAGGRAVEPGVLVDAIWGAEPPSGPAAALQTLVSRLRRALGEAEAITQVTGGYRLAVDPARVDALRFEQLIAAGRERLRAGDARPAAAGLTEAMTLWGDPVGTEPAVIAAVAPTVATRLARLSVEAVVDLASAELSLGRAETAEERLTGLLAEHPVQERAAALLMDALAAQGRQAEALAAYERIRGALADALGADPGTALRDRHLRLLHPFPAAADAEFGLPPHGTVDTPTGASTAGAGAAGAGAAGATAAGASTAGASTAGASTAGASTAGASTAGASTAGASTAGATAAGTSTAGTTAAGTSATDTSLAGTRSGSGPAEPAADRPSTADFRRTTPSRLPAPLTSFIGRDDDLARVGMLLGAGRLVTVVGPGGAGKTRLAIEAARGRAYPDGVFLIDLAPVTDADKVAGAVLAGIGLRGGALFDARSRAGGDELDVLAGRECLLLVDNCEHLIDAVAHLVAAALAHFPGLRVLATSREPLAIDGESLVPLGPLPLPAAGDNATEADRAASVRLFAARAAAVQPGFRVDESTVDDVVRVVRGLDGLPLALELAAARLRTMSLSALAGGLSDRFRLLTTGHRTAPARHRTLRGVIAWSWGLLDADERTVAERISVLPGGVTTASAAAVCAGTGVAADDIPHLLAALVDRSLLQLAPGRYRMLETIREYGVERLTASGALGTVRDLAAAHVTALIARHDPELRGPGQLTALRVVGDEYDNTLAALRHLCDVRDSPGAVSLALSLTWYWQMAGRHLDGGHWLGAALAVPGGETPGRDCARAIVLLNRADLLSGITTGEAADDSAEMRVLAGRLLAHTELPSHYRLFGPILLFLQDEPAALNAFARLADGSEVWPAGLAHMFLAEMAENAGALDRARVHVDASLAFFLRAGDGWGRAAVLPMRARLRRYDDLDGARADLEEARTLAAGFGALSLGDQLYSDLRWIDLHIRGGDTVLASELLQAARERALRASSAEMLALVDAQEAALQVRLGDLDRAGALLDDLDRADALHDGLPAGAGVARVLAAGARAALRLARGDLPGADRALREARAAAVETRELPVLALVTVAEAEIAAARGLAHESAVLLGVAARLRGAHDRTDPQVRALTRRCEAALGVEVFAAAYDSGRLTVTPAPMRSSPA